MPFDDLHKYDVASAALLNRPEVQVLTAADERSLLLELDALKTLLFGSHQEADGEMADEPHDGADIQDLVRGLLEPGGGRDEPERRLSQAAARYNEIRNRLAMANLRLVAHVAKKYLNRGVSSSDLLQEGFCGLLKAIDRFQTSRETRLASYAVWWIRQSLQRAVAAGAYPVRLNPRHLQQLAQSHSEPPAGPRSGRKSRSAGASSTIGQILSATRPTVSLNASVRADEGNSLIDALTYPAVEEAPTTELDEYLVVMMQQLKPREQIVLQLRYGLGGKECHSLSQVSEILDVSKERIRQIQEAALRKLRSLAQDKVCCAATR